MALSARPYTAAYGCQSINLRMEEVTREARPGGTGRQPDRQRTGTELSSGYFTTVSQSVHFTRVSQSVPEHESSFFRIIAPVEQYCSQRPQRMQLYTLTCGFFLRTIFLSLNTTSRESGTISMHPDGQTCAHREHPIHFSSIRQTFPRNPTGIDTGLSG
jgi:hypothetical protein